MAGGRGENARTGISSGSELVESVVGQLVADLGSEHIAEVCGLFLADARKGLRAIRSACVGGDADTAARSAHRLKSASGFLGARRVSTLCREIEHLANDHRLDDVASRVDDVSDELDWFSDELVALVERLGASETTAGRPPASAS